MIDVTALGATLLHSLWQATLLAAILWMASRRPGLSADFRYRLAYGTLLLQVCLSVATFLHYHTPAPRLESTIKQIVVDLVVPPSTAPLPAGTDWMLILVFCYGLSLVAGSSKLMLSVGRVRRMQRESEYSLTPQMRDHLRQLADRIGFDGRLHLALNRRIAAPMVVGHLKPLLLLPLATVNQLTTQETEAVLLHELAHLRRYDPYFNLLQCLIELAFYYHPAVHWIGARIREEREYCCDDLVLLHGPGQLPYARALLHYGRQGQPGLATVLSLTDGSGLLCRVRRLLNNQPTIYTMNRKLILLPVLALVVLITTAARPSFLATADSAPAAPPALDTLPDGEHEVVKTSNGKTTRLKVKDGEIEELVIENDTIPPVDYDDYEDTAEALLDDRPGSRFGVFKFDGGEQPTRMWRFDRDSASLKRLDALTLRTAEMDSLLAATRFEFDFDSITRLYERTIERVNLDSLKQIAKSMGRMSLDLDSIRMSWDIHPPDYRFDFFDPRDSLSLPKLERRERQLEKQLERVKQQRRELEERDSDQGSFFGPNVDSLNRLQQRELVRLADLPNLLKGTRRIATSQERFHARMNELSRGASREMQRAQQLATRQNVAKMEARVAKQQARLRSLK